MGFTLTAGTKGGIGETDMRQQEAGDMVFSSTALRSLWVTVSDALCHPTMLVVLETCGHGALPGMVLSPTAAQPAQPGACCAPCSATHMQCQVSQISSMGLGTIFL